MTHGKRIYLASSWRNQHYLSVLASLRSARWDVYDFRNPRPGDRGFHWSELDPNWQSWSADQYRNALRLPLANSGFSSDYDAMQEADIGVLLLPCGRSAHLEAGYFVGAGKPLHILIQDFDTPELMYKMASSITTSVEELLTHLEVA